MMKLCLSKFAVCALAVNCLFVAGVPTKAAPRGQKTTALKARPNYVVGRALSNAGKPLSGVEIGIYGTTIAGANTRFEAKTDAAGRFSQRVPEGIYGVGAYYKTKFNGKNYNFTLMPTDGITAIKHDSAQGIVKEFRWKISGLKAGESTGDTTSSNAGRKYYGSYISLSSKEEGFGGDRVYFPANSTLIVTLTPRGKLIDGSVGRIKTFKHSFSEDEKYRFSMYLTDIPVGLYALRAALQLPDGTKKALGVQKAPAVPADFKAFLNLDFEPTQFGDLQMMQVVVQP